MSLSSSVHSAADSLEPAGEGKELHCVWTGDKVMELKVGATYRSMVEAEVVAEADVVVLGGGTTGPVAAIAAARNGASVLLVERRGYLGGMMTAGNAGLTDYIVNDRDPEQYRKIVGQLASDPGSVQVVGGIPLEITNRLIQTKAALGTSGQAGTYVFTAQQEFKRLLLTMMEEAGVRLLLHSLVVDVIKEGDSVKGIVVENKSGRQIVLGKVFIDATGDGDVAAKAGAPFVVGVGPDDLVAQRGVPLGAMASMGVMFRVGNVNVDRLLDYLAGNPEIFIFQELALMSFADCLAAHKKGDMMTFIVRGTGHVTQIYNTPLPGVLVLCCPSYSGNGLSASDLTRAEIAVTKDIWKRMDTMRAEWPGFENSYLLDLPEIFTRETRHILGEYIVTIDDLHSSRAFPDSIGRGAHIIDTSHIPASLRNYPLPSRWSFSIPYRCLVARDVANLLVAGRCISATHEASGCIRVTAACMMTGEAAGTAAAMCVAENTIPRRVDTARLRAVLSDHGAIV
jgi:hypothetical protein